MVSIRPFFRSVSFTLLVFPFHLCILYLNTVYKLETTLRCLSSPLQTHKKLNNYTLYEQKSVQWFARKSRAKTYLKQKKWMIWDHFQFQLMHQNFQRHPGFRLLGCFMGWHGKHHPALNQLLGSHLVASAGEYPFPLLGKWLEFWRIHSLEHMTLRPESMASMASDTFFASPWWIPVCPISMECSSTFPFSHRSLGHKSTRFHLAIAIGVMKADEFEVIIFGATGTKQLILRGQSSFEEFHQ